MIPSWHQGVDGEDVMWRTNERHESICIAMGRDSTGVELQEDLTPEDQEHHNPILRFFTE